MLVLRISDLLFEYIKDNSGIKKQSLYNNLHNFILFLRNTLRNMIKKNGIRRDREDITEIIFIFLSTIFTVSLILTYLIEMKLFSFFNLPISCSIIIYPITFMVNNIISEVYGHEFSKTLVKNGVSVVLIIIFIIFIVNILSIHPESPIKQASFDRIFILIPRAKLGFTLSYILSQFAVIEVFNFFRKIAPYKLWIRNSISVIIGLLVSIQFTKEWIIFSYYDYLFGVVIMICYTPIVYFITYFINKKLETKKK